MRALGGSTTILTWVVYVELPNRDLKLQLEGKHDLGRIRTFKQKLNRLLIFLSLKLLNNHLLQRDCTYLFIIQGHSCTQAISRELFLSFLYMFREGRGESCLAVLARNWRACEKCADLTGCLRPTLPGHQFHKHLENEVSTRGF